MNFIKLTEKFQNGDKRDIHINFDLVNMFKVGDRNSDTFIQMNDGKYFFVKESCNEIWRLVTSE